MSDFDKEAEREQLREKYERDQQKREATERMSELLLKGATMTNAHCDQCGDPVFRYDGQEFCPSCEEVVGEGGEAAAEGEGGEEVDADDEGSSAEAAENGAKPAGGATDEPESDAPSEAESDPASEAESPVETQSDAAASADTGAAGTAAQAQDTTASTPQRNAPTAPSGGSAAANAPETGASGSASSTPATGGEGNLATARESLVRTLVAQTRQAEACDDPRRARDHLAAAREAAEALSALPY